MVSEVSTRFERMGARVEVTVVDHAQVRWAEAGDELRRPVRIDVQRDADGREFFALRLHEHVEVRVLDLRPRDRHLLLMTREPGQDGADGGVASRFLCGHDERAWFVAAIPEEARAATVQDAMDALKPQEVWDAILEHGVQRSHRDRRRTAAFIRQGEWFFIPRPGLKVRRQAVLGHEPIQRGGGKPHVCQFLYRTGGRKVYVSFRHPNGLTQEEFDELSARERRETYWDVRVRDARVYAKGNVRHPDHKTVFLADWHEVVMNTETKAVAMQHVAFLD